MFIRITENDKGLAVMFCIPTYKGFAVTTTINKIKEVQLQEFKMNVSPTGCSIAVCKRSNGKMMAIPFEVCLIDKNVFEKYENKQISANPTNHYNKNLSDEMYVFVHVDAIDFICEQYKDILGVIDLRAKKAKKDDEDLILSDEDWDLLNNKKEAEQ